MGSEQEQTVEGVSLVRAVGVVRTHLQVVPTLVELERIIETGRQNWIQAAHALTVIRDERLYLQTHTSFEAYCRDRWGFSRQRASQLITAGTQSTTVDIANEGQARRLRRQAREGPIEDEPQWQALADIVTAIEALASSDAPTVAATVPERRRAATARKLRKLGLYLGGIAWSLEGMEQPR